MKPLCFVLMPFGTKPAGSGRSIDFDSVYSELIQPAIVAAELEPLRADEEQGGGVIHKPMYERLLLCEFAVADLTTANANVFYELGIRHAALPRSTVMVFADGTGQLPFDVKPLRGLPYQLGSDGKPSSAEADVTALTDKLTAARSPDKDSPLYQLVEDYPDVQHEKTDVFRDRVAYAQTVKDKLAVARKEGLEAVRAIEATIAPVADAESGVVIDLFLSYRSVKAWDDMIRLVDQMSEPLRRTVLVQEQLGLALNRADRGDEAERVLLQLIKERGPSSETHGILGRVYKDRWEAAASSNQAALARGFLSKAIDTYVKGFETDWRDAYPGVNAVTLMELANPTQEDDRARLRQRQAQLLPVVRYAVERRIAAGKPDYWDHATRLEVAVLENDQGTADAALGDALAAARESWERETTARNLGLIRKARSERGDDTTWISEIEKALA